MGWLRRLVRRLWVQATKYVERLIGRYDEGPEMPVRFAQAVAAFAALNPKATQGEWLAFTVGHAEQTFRAGYLRGVEWRERGIEQVDQAAKMTLDEMGERHDWDWTKLAPAEEQLAEIVRTHPELVERMSPEERVFYMDRIGREMGGFRVVLLPSSDPKER